MKTRPINSFGLETVGITILDPAGQPAEVIGVVKSNPAPPSKAGLGTANYLTENLKGSNPILAAHFRAPLLLSLPGAELNANVVSPGYLNALDLPLVSGLGFPQHSMAGPKRVLASSIKRLPTSTSAKNRLARV